MKFPYGISDFRSIVKDDYFYCDRTDRITDLEKQGKFLLFLRPRRFGKSLLLSMLKNYYDLARKNEFDKIFGKLKIAKNFTALHSKYFILHWDFSCIDPSGTAEEIKRALHNHINSRIKTFTMYYEDYKLRNIQIDANDAVISIESLISAVQMTPYPIYLLIDEYDNFANEVMMGLRRGQGIYEALVYEEGPLKTIFKAIKASTSDSAFDRIFITGVSPVVMSDITSGYNIAKNIYLDERFNNLCGFTEQEVKNTLKKIVIECEREDKESEKALNIIKKYYNGYKFAFDAEELVYNPTLAIYFMAYFYDKCKYPRTMLDSNLATDEAKLRYVSKISKGRQLLLELVRHNKLEISTLSDRFGIENMLSDKSKDNSFMASFLYYFGVLTMEGETELGKLNLKVPNLVMRGLYVERIKEMLLPEPEDRDDGVLAAEELYQRSNIKPICEFIEQRYFKVFSNRDYKWANELTIKTAFLTLLYNDILYIMDSEKELRRGYADLTMIIRPDMRRFKILDILLEFKYVKLKDIGFDGKQARKLSKEEIEKLPAVMKAMKEAKSQLKSYGDELEKKYNDLRLKRYAVVSLAFERLCWEKVIV
ncbi:AAA-ATPase-like domain-containing protein [Candidatus Magnetomoraceae bacterium gMMP-1]